MNSFADVKVKIEKTTTKEGLRELLNKIDNAFGTKELIFEDHEWSLFSDHINNRIMELDNATTNR